MNRRYLFIAGRTLVSVIFILSGITKVADWSGTAQYMATQGMPLIPLFLSASILVELAGGLSLLFGWFTRWSAILLFLYLIPTTLIFHNFWAYSGVEQQTQLVNFLKNLAIMGGLLLVACEARDAQSIERERLEPVAEEASVRPPRPKIVARAR